MKGKIHAEEVKVDLQVPGPDYVFRKTYPLPQLSILEKYIDKHKHLPQIASAKEMQQDGIEVGQLNMQLLQKVEELTLYVIALKKENIAQQKQINKVLKQSIRNSRRR